MNFIRTTFGARSWLGTVDAFIAFVLGWIYFSLVITLFSLLAGLAIFIVTIPIFGWIIYGYSRAVSWLERGRVEVFYRKAVGDPHRPTSGNVLTRLLEIYGRPVTWKELLYQLVLPWPATVWFVALTVLWSTALACFSAPFMPGDWINFGSFTPTGSERLLGLPLGIIFLVAALWTGRSWAVVIEWLVQSLLGRGRDVELAERVDELTESRAIALQAAEAERRRIERDLHDGAQQQLVALSMNLGMAKSKLDTDPEAARQLLDEAHEQAKTALVELRDLARGIHPVSLDERGLAGAIEALTSRSAVPVQVQVSMSNRAAPEIEGIAYFVVSEALTNVAKHAEATQARVTVTDAHDRLAVIVQDDGRGGADATAGSGLRGLTDRVRGVDGTLIVVSPVGGPTTITCELPMSIGVSS